MVIAPIAGLLLFIAAAAAGTVGDDQAQLLSFLFTNYEKDVRPICDTDEPIDVRVGVAIRQIIELDEPKQILIVNAWLRLVWFDCHLQWNASQYSNIGNIIVPYSKIWSPDITLYDNAAEELEGFEDYLVNVYSTGWCHYNFPTVIRALCRIDVTYFPFDTQVCPLKFGSWAHHGLEINTSNRSGEGDMTSFVPNTEWNLLKLPVENNIIYYQCCPEPYPDVTYFVTMKRKPLFYVLNLLFPCILITAVALLGFLLPPDAGEKVSLEITVLLSLAVFLLVVSETLPASSENFPYIGVFFAVAMVLVSLSTLLTVTVLNFHFKGNLNRPVPQWIRTVAFHWLGRVLLLESDSCTIFPESYNDPKKMKKGHSNDGFKDETFINGYQEHHSKDHAQCNGNGNLPPITRIGPEFYDRSNAMSPEPEAPTSVTRIDMHPTMQPLVDVMKQQVRIMEKLEVRKDNKLKHDHLCSEWKKVGIVLDRFFLAVFSTVAVISSLAILLQLGSS